jgi:hypothetical protein
VRDMWRWRALGGWKEPTSAKKPSDANVESSGSSSSSSIVDSRPRKRRRHSSTTHFSATTAEQDLIRTDDEFGETLEDLKLPSDTLAAFKILRKEFPVYSGVSDIPVVLQHHVLSLVEDRTQVNQELDVLIGEHVLRRTYLSTGKEDFLIVFCDDYRRLIVKHAREAKSPLEQTILHIFEQILPYIPTMYTTSHEIVALYSAFLNRWNYLRGTPPGEGPGAGGSDGASEKHFTDIAISQELEALLKATTIDPKQAPSILLSCGFFMEKQMGGGKTKAYCLVVPYIGQYLKYLLSGRKKVMRVVRAHQFKEILESELRKVSFKENFFNVNFFVRDIIGSDDVYVLKTSSGRLIRLHRKS